jgi:hypothetical protein
MPPRLGNARGPSDAVERQKAEDMRNKFWREKGEKIAGKDRG